MEPAKRLQYVPDPNKFDLRTHHWNGQGQLAKKNLYTNHVVGGSNYFERPVNSGNLWFENNQPAGRVEYVAGPDGKTVKMIKEGVPHIEFIPKLEGDDALFYALEQQKTRTAELEAELAAIKAEKVPAAPAAAEPVKQAATPAPLSLGKDKA